MGRRPKPKEHTIGNPFDKDGKVVSDSKELINNLANPEPLDIKKLYPKKEELLNSFKPSNRDILASLPIEQLEAIAIEKNNRLKQLTEPQAPIPPTNYVERRGRPRKTTKEAFTKETNTMETQEEKEDLLENNLQKQDLQIEKIDLNDVTTPTIDEINLSAKSSVPSDQGDDLLESSLSQNFESENNIKSVSKELFSKKNIEVKTEVNHDEINNITRLQFLKEKFQISNVNVLVQNFLELRVSKDRKSRKEFIEALQADNRNSNPATGLAKWFGGGGGQT